MDPEFVPVHMVLGQALEQKHTCREAVLEFGDGERALALLAQAVGERCPRTAFLGVDRRFDVLRSDLDSRRYWSELGQHRSRSTTNGRRPDLALLAAEFGRLRGAYCRPIASGSKHQ